MKSSTLLIITLVIISQLGYAQKNFVPGYVINPQGDTIRGYILDRGWDKNPKSIQFKNSEYGEEIVFTANEISEFKIDGGSHYFGFKIEVDKSPYKVFQMAKYLPTNDVVKDTIFLELLANGRLDLFRLRDESEKYHYYYRTISGIPQELILKVTFQEVNGETTMTTTPTYKSQLKKLMEDCTQVLPTISTLKYVQREMVKLFNGYNNCVGESITMEPLAKTEFEWFVSSGVSHTQLKFNGQPGITFDASIDPTFAVGLNTIFPRNRNVWSVYSEIQYKPYKTRSNANAYIFDLGYLRAAAAYRYSYTKSTIKPYAQAGVLVGHAFKFESNRLTEKLDPGAFVSAGLRSNKLAGEFRFEKTTGMHPSFPIQSVVTSYYLLLFYKIN